MSDYAHIRQVPVRIGEPYWEREAPKVAKTGNLYLFYYPEAGKLRISLRYRNPETGEICAGRTIVLSRDDFQESPQALSLLHSIVSEWGEVL